MNSKGTTRKRKSAKDFDSNLNGDNKRIALRELSCAKQVFGTQLLLEEILTNLDKEHLLKFRSLSKAWNGGACKLLHNRESHKITIRCPTYPPNKTRSGVPFSSSIRKRSKSKLELLTETISRSIQVDLIFPHSHFEIYDLQLRSTVTQNFLSNCGHIINYFEANFPESLSKEGRPLLVHLKNLLFHQLPNLHYLQLSINRSEDSEGFLKNKNFDSKFVEQFLLRSDSDSTQVARVLPKLKQLEFSCSIHIPILKAILKAAVNLEQLHMFVCEYYDDGENVLDLIPAMGKTHLVSSLDLSIEQKLLDLTENFLETSLHLKIRKLHLQLSKDSLTQGFHMRAGRIVEKIIFSCAIYVEELDTYLFFLHPAFQIPLMPKLRRLYLMHMNHCWPFFPTNFKMSRVFPQLNVIKILIRTCSRMSQRLFEESFLGASYDDQILTLESIKFDPQFGDMRTLSLPGMFRNLVSVDMGLILNIPQAFHALWSLAHLQILKFVVQRGNENNVINENLGYELESALTGLSKDTCIKLASKGENVDLTTVESLRVNRSMVDSKRLRKLHMRIEDSSEPARTKTKGNRIAFLSQVTGQFAFKMCPSVQISIHVHAYLRKNVKALLAEIHPVLEYVTRVTDSSCKYRDTESSSCSSCQL